MDYARGTGKEHDSGRDRRDVVTSQRFVLSSSSRLLNEP